MTIAIMQPYLFPYIGYYQLIQAADKFIVYDDVNFINKGWINRNNILVGGKPHLFTIPLKDASQNKLIREVELATDPGWKKKLLKTLVQSYQKAPYFQNVFDMIEEIVNLDVLTISEMAVQGLKKTCAYMQIGTEITPSTTIYGNSHLKGQERILDICRQEQATHYINPAGGTELYDKERFAEESIQLSFLKSTESPYPQLKNAFVPWLSVIDVLMFNAPEQIGEHLKAYQLF
ncbi:WbqC family protein [Dyadobacter sandarakinus]|uniref:WbqC family protein n=1 Tax=Dyadobacter sandarakinus TaxID=2747268 RepID=A0ABX7IDF6_9BACT|nr:WbqC family protein [Dyadobacter sandarakinus]QRR03733.1 WbqC family protein [Dyadobacter sandarakinus]